MLVWTSNRSPEAYRGCHYIESTGRFFIQPMGKQGRFQLLEKEGWDRNSRVRRIHNVSVKKCKEKAELLSNVGIFQENALQHS